MAPARRPAKRLLIPPALLLAAVLAVVIAVASSSDRDVDPSLQVDGILPVVDADPEGCRRDRDEPAPEPLPAPPDVGRVTSSMVVACPTAADGRRVTYAGELVGDLLRRDGGAWVLVNDDDYALSVGPLPVHGEHRGSNSGLTVWLPADLVDDITGLGRPYQRGDIVQLEGNIQRTDPDDGGGLTLRADQMTILRPAQTLADPLEGPRALLAAASLLAAGLLWTLRRRARR